MKIEVVKEQRGKEFLANLGKGKSIIEIEQEDKEEHKPYYCIYLNKVCGALKIVSEALEQDEKEIINLKKQLKNCREQNLRLINESKRVMDNRIKLVFDDIERVSIIQPIGKYGCRLIDVNELNKLKKKHKVI